MPALRLPFEMTPKKAEEGDGTVRISSIGQRRLNLLPSMSIWTPRAVPGFGKNSLWNAYPTIRNFLIVGNTHPTVDQMMDLFRHTRQPDIFANVVKKILKVNLLLVTGTKRSPRLLPDKRDNGTWSILALSSPFSR